MRPDSTGNIKSLIFQYFLYQASLSIFLRNHQFNQSKCQSNAERMSQNPFLNHFINQSFEEAKRLVVLSIENPTNRTKWIQELLINLT